MPNIFEYMDYREYLEDYYLDRKRENPGFSFQVFANIAGFRSKSFIKEVIDGKKRLTKESAEKFNNVLKLGEKAFSYFLDLIELEHADSLDKKNYYLEKLQGYSQRNSAKIIKQQQYDFYAHWYHNTIREILVHFDFKEDYALLGRMVKPNISGRKARQSVELLIDLGLIKKTKTGYVQTDTVISTGNTIWSLAIQNFHLQNMAIAASSIETVPRPERDISSIVVGLSEKGFETYKAEIEKVRSRLLQLAEKERNVEKVYHVNFQMFPTSGVLECGKEIPGE
jgi:uncharacterized protein (TIGR02147 family)